MSEDRTKSLPDESGDKLEQLLGLAQTISTRVSDLEQKKLMRVSTTPGLWAKPSK
ncbi:MAG: hypothetical protein ACRD9R_18455 [Pyrinomonadaceae bacterium]